MNNKHLLFVNISLALLLSACAGQQQNTQPEASVTEESTQTDVAPLNDYPTRDRVEYVLECAAKHGGLGYISQIACGCKIDKIAEKLSFADYEAARTFNQMQKTPGEAGAVFRDPKQSKDLRSKLKEADEAAEKACFVK